LFPINGPIQGVSFVPGLLALLDVG
jgi:hypothetical protein